MQETSFKEKLVYFSPWIFAAACTLLVVIIAFLVMSTYQRESDFKRGALQQQAESVVRSVFLGFRKSAKQGLEHRDGQFSFLSYIQQALEDATVQAGVAGAYVITDTGKILVSAVGEDAKAEKFRVPETFLRDGRFALQESRFYFSEREVNGEENHYLVLTSFKEGRHPRNSMHNKMHSRSVRDVLRERFEERRLYLVLDLNLGEFNTSFGAAQKQIFILSFVLLLVVSGACLSFMALRNLSLSQRRLARLGRFQEQLLGSLPIGLIAVSDSGVVKLVNRELARIDADFWQNALGKDEQEINRNFTIDCHQEFANELRTLFIYGGKKVLAFSKVTVASDDGTSDGYVILIEDVTQQHHLREELERSSRMASLGKMAAGVAHELRNPLSSVKGLGVLLQSRFEVGCSDYKTASVLVAEVDRLNRSISELLDFAKPKNHLGDLFAIRNCIQKAVDLVAMDIEDMDAGIEVSLPPVSVQVRGDEDKLNQVFLNILLNAIQAIDHKGKIEVDYRVAESGEVTIDIRDDGPGIVEEIASQIYDPYFTTKADGTGLGLAVSTKVVEDHGGNLRVENHRDGGALARVVLPCA